MSNLFPIAVVLFVILVGMFLSVFWFEEDEDEDEY